jgi:hypothetical protein
MLTPEKISPVVLIIESDSHVCNALKAELEDDITALCFESINAAIDAYEAGRLPHQVHAAIVQMVSNTKDELSKLTQFFNQITDVPIFLTLSYDGDFQLEQSHIRSWTERIYFRPFEIDKLVSALKATLR